MSKVDISVVIPTHNRRDLLREMLEALACQTFPAPRFEVIVVADGVTDGTQEMLRRLETPYSLGVLDQWQSGVAVARNRGARCARGSLLVFLDDDVLPVPRLLEEHALTQRENPPGVVLGRLLPAGTGRKKGWQVWEERVFQKHYQAVLEGRRPPAGRRLYSGNFSVPRLAFLQVGGFNEGMERGEDIELGFRLEQAGVPFYFNPAAAAIHRGYRSFASWRRSAYLYGRTDVLLARRGIHAQSLSEIWAWYHRKPPPFHWFLGLSLGRPGLQSALAGALAAWGGLFTRLGMPVLAHPAYSLIFNLQYWQGVADELGGRAAFYRHLGSWRPSGHLPPAGVTEPSRKPGLGGAMGWRLPSQGGQGPDASKNVRRGGPTARTDPTVVAWPRPRSSAHGHATEDGEDE